MAKMREVETRSLANTTSPDWRQSFHMPIENVSHVLRIIALHDAQKGAPVFLQDVHAKVLGA